MKKIIAILLIICTFSIPLTVFAEEEEGPSIYDITETGVFTHEGTDLPYRYYLPQDYSLENTYPLVVFLHAETERGDNNSTQLKYGATYLFNKMPDAIILAPQCGLDNQWVDTPIEGGNYSIAEVPESDELAAVMALISKMKTDYMVDTERIYAVGASMGGYGVWDLIMRHNDTFAAGVVVCGAGDPTQAEVVKDTPMYVFHSALDEEKERLSDVRDLTQAVYDAGGTKLRYFEDTKLTYDLYYQIWWGQGVLENLPNHRLSDKYIREEVTEEMEEQEVVSSDEGETVVDAGVVTPPSIWSIIGFIMLFIIFVLIIVIFVVREKKL